jgi:hypothetical protein
MGIRFEKVRNARYAKKGAQNLEDRGEAMGIGLVEIMILLIMLMQVPAMLWMVSKRRHRNHKAVRWEGTVDFQEGRREMLAIYGLGATELLIIFIIFMLLPVAVIGLILWLMFKWSNRERIGIIESRLERVERQIDRIYEQAALKQRE